MPCVNHTSGEFKLIFTNQMVKGKAMIPFKTCANCNRSYPVLSYIKHGVLKKDGYMMLEDGDSCYLCDPPSDIFINVDSSDRTRMRVKLRKENGQPIKFWDRKDHCWRALENIGIHRMTRDGNEFRLQPYQNRRTTTTGIDYK